jgi:hypothetical protein
MDAHVNFLLLARRKRSLRSLASSMCVSLSQNAHLLYYQLYLRSFQAGRGRQREWGEQDKTYLTSLGKSGMKNNPPRAQLTVMRPLMI